jgi:citrate lyase subunit beta/citryl-CoA lyase
VVPAEKAASRAHAIHALKTLDFGARTRLLRINGLDTPWAYRDLVDVIEAAGDRVDLVMLPKASGPRDVVFVDMLLGQIEAHRGLEWPIGIEAQIESAQGYVHLRAIAAASPRLEALVFGPGDYAASMRMPSSGIGAFDANDELYPGHRWHAAMHELVASGRANGLRCIDGPYAAFKDAAGFDRSCRIARAMGFDGKQCIHPGQLAAANALFSPTADEIAIATAIVQAFDDAVASGRGAATHDGRMIDAASLRMARTTLDRVRQEQGSSGPKG